MRILKSGLLYIHIFKKVRWFGTQSTHVKVQNFRLLFQMNVIFGKIKCKVMFCITGGNPFIIVLENSLYIHKLVQQICCPFVEENL